MTYNKDISLKFARQYKKLYKKNPSQVSIIDRLIDDVLEHPTTGLGRPERLKHRGGKWYSREIDKKNRLVYRIISSDEVRFEQCLGHYNDH
ncbi:MAG: type II toxin-antitoxin system YoeB family toxin [Puniceicoccales bacterium]|jgi:toxin YoeB|nr:type II toxin-antitoxin system YoeB family toxin [Puniceicoccales bacterium]